MEVAGTGRRSKNERASKVMPDNNSWAERRQRMVKCKKHGLHYDPEMSTGCTRCLREAAKIRTTRPPQLVLIFVSSERSLRPTFRLADELPGLLQYLNRFHHVSTSTGHKQPSH